MLFITAKVSVLKQQQQQQQKPTMDWPESSIVGMMCLAETEIKKCEIPECISRLPFLYIFKVFFKF